MRDRKSAIIIVAASHHFEDELACERPGPASALLAARRPLPAAISIVTLGEFAEGFLDPVALNEFVSPFRVVQLSRMIAWRAALLRTSMSRRLGENDAWIAATAIAYGATLVGRERAFSRVPRLDYLPF
jgi:predicted nucleic acid-binding protein